LQTFHLHIQGQVQGVGFRPYVYRLATGAGLAGWVSNGADGVHVEVEVPTEAHFRDFLDALQAGLPPLARVASVDFWPVPHRAFAGFKIADSAAASAATMPLTPDFALCPDCRLELHQPTDRRRGYAFITCTNCGPRYSIVERLPYDRPQTTMRGFAMCATCVREYHDPLDRRHYSQTNSCPDCGVALRLWVAREQHWATGLDQAGLVAEVARRLLAGRIVAVKGLGGYLLLADACHAEPLRTLRARKHRPTKPFALLYPSVAMLAQDVFLAPDEQALLQGPAAPICLLPARPRPASGVQVGLVAPGLGLLGAMLPYTPLLDLLAQAVGCPLVATSANLSQSPIEYDDERALAHLPALADDILLHNRPIVVPQDDSVVRLAPASRQPIVVRRARGLAPSLHLPHFRPGADLLATGAMLKGTFALAHAGHVYVSQYLGNLLGYDNQQNYQHNLAHLGQVLGHQPAAIVTDLHPSYPTTQLGHQLAQAQGLPVVAVQHHLAHFAAVLGERGLVETTRPVLGVVWDGTGLGTDGHVWGGEFFCYADGAFDRVAHLSYFPHLASDKMALEPRLAALAACQGLPEAERWLRPKFSAAEWATYQQLARRPKLHTSSVGRLLDAVASLLGLADRNRHEGEAAMYLEALALGFVQQAGVEKVGSYLPAEWPGAQVPTCALVGGVLADLQRGVAPAQIAAKVHGSLIGAVRVVAQRLGVAQIAFSGGVFQNALLVDLAHQTLAGYELYFHEQLPPNDENISFGQLVYWHLAHEKIEQQQMSKKAGQLQELV
jgi:hydrogenase maturation protein HypF